MFSLIFDWYKIILLWYYSYLYYLSIPDLIVYQFTGKFKIQRITYFCNLYSKIWVMKKYMKYTLSRRKKYTGSSWIKSNPDIVSVRNSVCLIIFQIFYLNKLWYNTCFSFGLLRTILKWFNFFYWKINSYRTKTFSHSL